MKHLSTLAMVALLISSAHYCGMKDQEVRPCHKSHHSCKDSTVVADTVKLKIK